MHLSVAGEVRCHTGQCCRSHELCVVGAFRDFLRRRFGNEWFARREAGSLLRELWSLGQGPTADELLADVTGAEIEMSAVADRVREIL